LKAAAALMLCLLAVSMPAASQEPLTYEQRITRLTETLSYIREHDVAS
jgi:predicted secreted protein